MRVSHTKLIRNPCLALAFGLGAGLTPKLPGTVGTLWAIPLWWWLSGLGTTPYLVITGCVFVFGVWICNRAMSKLEQHDHPGIVLDEIVGYLLALVVVPASVGWVLLSFVLFRFFDIVKPWPINWLDQHVRGGLGVMLDDLVAGIGTALIILIARGIN